MASPPLHVETEVRFAEPVTQVMAMVAGFSMACRDEIEQPVSGLRVGLGVTQQQFPSKVAQIHGQIDWIIGEKRPIQVDATIDFTAVGVE